MATGMFRVKHRHTGEKRVYEGGKARSSGRKYRVAAIAALAVLTAACSSPEEIAETAGLAQSAASVPPAPPAPPAPAPGKEAFTDKAAQGEAEREFAYSWPAEVSAVPPLIARFTAERDRLLADQKADWEGALKEFTFEDCAGCVMRSFEKEWEVVADLPRFLSLSATFYEYSGGAHGNGAFDALVWDREAKAGFDPKDMFRPEALQDALGAAWCKALKRQRMGRLGESYSDDGFFQCPPIADLTVLVGSSDGRAFNRIGLLAAPYVAGSYAEGAYEVTLPVTPAVIAAVKPEYKAAFALAK
jgi:hypothetical protein